MTIYIDRPESINTPSYKRRTITQTGGEMDAWSHKPKDRRADYHRIQIAAITIP